MTILCHDMKVWTHLDEKLCQKLWELINKTVKLGKIQKLGTIHYTEGNQEMVSFTNVVKYIEINLTKNIKDL